jgi:epoxyqueuosine reductase
LSPKEHLRQDAAALGFADMRVVDLAAVADQSLRLGSWLQAGFHGDMKWMAEHAARRAHPAALWPQARSAIALAANYAPDTDPLQSLKAPRRASLSIYAARRDYHDVLKGRLKILAGKLAARARCAVKVFVDTAPLMEKPLAAAAGLGWQGKHTALVSRAHGTWLFLGFILTDADLPPDAPETDHCGTCRACLDICPTAAFPKPYLLDARRCIAYLTVEHHGPIPREFRRPMGNRVFGCDDCLAVCPWNKFAVASRDAKLALRDDLASADLAELAALDDAAFRARFAGTPVKRAGRARFLRNVLVAIGNSGDADLAPPARALLEDASPLVRGAAVWALAQLLPAGQFAAIAAEKAPRESDVSVRAEWAHGWPEAIGAVSGS